MLNQFSRTQLLLGPDSMEQLYKKKVAVFGIGGVGGYVCEALVRSGIGSFDLIDDDKVCLTNLNRQIMATRKTVGKYKAEVMRDRMLEINPDAKIEIHKCFFLPENADEFPFGEYDYIVDAVDTVTAKIELVLRAQRENIPIISAMGAGNKLDAGRLKVADIYETKVCPLARVMRRELKKRNVKGLKVVYSDEQPIRPLEDISISCRAHCICPPGAQHKCTERRDIPGSTAFVPAVCGLLIAGEIIKDLNLEAKRVMDLDNPLETKLAEVDFTESEGSGKYICGICGYVYDPTEHDGIAFEDLPDGWKCPRCKQGKDKYNKA